MNVPVIDAKLPMLPQLFDRATVAAGFAANSSATIYVGRQQHLHYHPGQLCVATYELQLEQPPLPAKQTLGVAECTPSGLAYRLYPADPDLPWLASATATTAMHKYLNLLDNLLDNVADDQAQEWTVTPIRYRPGNRCSLRYTRRTATEEQHFFGKLFRHADEQRIAAMTACYQKAEASPLLPLFPKPLAYWPELQMVVTPMVQGTEFHTFAFDEHIPCARRVAWLRCMGQNVGAFHMLPRLDLPHVTWQKDLTALHEYLPAMAQVMPSLATRYQAALAAIPSVVGSVPTTDAVVSHGALRTDQFLMAPSPPPVPDEAVPQRLIVIDLDTLCLAHPARDLGNCLAYLIWKAMRQPQHTAFITTAQQALLAGYRERRPMPDPQWLSLNTALALLKIAGRRFRNLTYREWSLVPNLIQKAYTVLTHGGRKTYEALPIA